LYFDAVTKKINSSPHKRKSFVFAMKDATDGLEPHTYEFIVGRFKLTFKAIYANSARRYPSKYQLRIDDIFYHVLRDSKSYSISSTQANDKQNFIFKDILESYIQMESNVEFIEVRIVSQSQLDKYQVEDD